MRSIKRFSAIALATAIALPIMSANAAEDKARSWTKEELQELINQTIMENPRIIIDSVEKMQVEAQREQQAQIKQMVAAYKTSLFEDKTAPSAGADADDADVTVVEFLDYNCGYCRQSLPNITRLLEKDKKVRVIFKDFPVIAPTSDIAARAALAMNAVEPDKYFEFHSALFKMGGRFQEDDLVKTAESLGADGDDFREKLNSDKIKEQVEANKELGQKLGVRGVPAFIIGDEVFPGAIDFTSMMVEIERVRKEGKS